jgi:membrane protease YdiL (CAAX protease family)
MTVATPIDVFSSRWRAALAYGLLAAVLTVTVALPIATAWRAAPIGVDALGPLNLFAGQMVLATFLLTWFALQGGRSWRAFFSVPSGHWIARIARGIRVGLLGWLITIVAMVVLSAIARGADVAPQEGFTDLVVWMARRPLALRVLVIGVAMVVEEAFFRAFLQPRFGIATATLCFALSHVNYGSPIMGGGVFVIGLVLGLAFRRYGDLVVCAVAHGVFDAIQLLVILPLVASRL